MAYLVLPRNLVTLYFASPAEEISRNGRLVVCVGKCGTEGAPAGITGRVLFPRWWQGLGELVDLILYGGRRKVETWDLM